MAGIASLDISLKGIGHLLSEGKLAVPEYQRSYSWEQENVVDYFRDVYSAFQAKEAEYFLGSVVLTMRADKRLEVVDGQQRLATASLLIAAVCRYLLDRNEGKRSEILSENYLYKTDPKTLSGNPQFELNAQDNSFFQDVISLKNPAPTRESHKRILEAFGAAGSFIKSIAEKLGDPIPHLFDFINFWVESTKVIVAKVPDEENAWIIFETLNDRGLTLSTTDLLKNYLFGKAGANLSEVRQNWITMAALLDGPGGEALTLLYLRHVWASYSGLTREKELFDKVKEKVATQESVLGFSKQLVENARLYSCLLNPSDDFWKSYGNGARHSISVLLELRFTQPRPLMLAVISKFDAKQCERFFNFLVTCSIRFTVVGALGSSALENFYSNQAAAIRKGEIGSVDDLIKILCKEVPDDNYFRSAFESARVSSPIHARYYLRAMESSILGKELEFVPNENPDVVTLEHVVPRNPEGGVWGEFSEDEVDVYAKRLGNLALLKKGANSALGNKPFEEKKKILSDSDFLLTKEIAQFNEWNKDAIESRQKKLAEVAIKTWPIPKHK